MCSSTILQKIGMFMVCSSYQSMKLDNQWLTYHRCQHGLWRKRRHSYRKSGRASGIIDATYSEWDSYALFRRLDPRARHADGMGSSRHGRQMQLHATWPFSNFIAYPQSDGKIAGTPSYARRSTARLRISLRRSHAARICCREPRRKPGYPP